MVTKIVTRLLATLLIAAIDSFFVMLLLGNAHENDGRVPAFGYVTILPLVLSVSLITGALSRVRLNDA
jgi:hypothetical protein